MAIASSMMRRLHRNVLLGTLAVVALLQPAMVPFSPDMAGRMPNHGHIYAGGVAVPHSHPGEDPAAHEPHDAASAASAGDEAAPDAAPDAAVVFTFEDLGLFASVIAPAVAGALATPEAVAAPRLAEPAPPMAVVVSPRPQPPQT